MSDDGRKDGEQSPVVGMRKRATFRIRHIGVSENSEGAARLLSHLSSPRNFSADMRKLRDFHLVLEGGRPFQHRSRRQVRDGALLVWQRLAHAVRVGEWHQRSFIYQRRADPAMSPAIRAIGAPLRHSVGDRRPREAWKPWLPVAHLAAGFHIAMLKTLRGRYFSMSADEDTRVHEVTNLLFNDHGWILPTLEQAEAHMVLLRLKGMQSPPLTRHFILVDEHGSPVLRHDWGESQK